MAVGVWFAVLHKVLSGTGATLVETRARVLGKLEEVDWGDRSTWNGPGAQDRHVYLEDTYESKLEGTYQIHEQVLRWYERS